MSAAINSDDTAIVYFGRDSHGPHLPRSPSFVFKDPLSFGPAALDLFSHATERQSFHDNIHQLRGLKRKSDPVSQDYHDLVAFLQKVASSVRRLILCRPVTLDGALFEIAISQFILSFCNPIPEAFCLDFDPFPADRRSVRSTNATAVPIASLAQRAKLWELWCNGSLSSFFDDAFALGRDIGAALKSFSCFLPRLNPQLDHAAISEFDHFLLSAVSSKRIQLAEWVGNASANPWRIVEDYLLLRIMQWTSEIPSDEALSISQDPTDTRVFLKLVSVGGNFFTALDRIDARKSIPSLAIGGARMGGDNPWFLVSSDGSRVFQRVFNSD